MKQVTIQTKDGFPLAATVFEPPSPLKGVLVIGSALGVPRYLYYKFGRFISQHGFVVLVFDYRGIFESRNKKIRGSEIKMEDWGTFDINAALSWVHAQFPDLKIYYLGHSCGGQLVGLASACTEIRAMVFIAAQTGYWKLWPFPYHIAVFLAWYLLIPLVAPLFDYFPARVLQISSVNFPSGVARQWAAWGRTANYLFDEKFNLDTHRYPEIQIPLLSIGFADDRMLAPPKAIDELLTYYPNADISRMHVSPADYGLSTIGHFGFFREQSKGPLWDEVLEWILVN